MLYSQSKQILRLEVIKKKKKLYDKHQGRPLTFFFLGRYLLRILFSPLRIDFHIKKNFIFIIIIIEYLFTYNH